jgi:hypothetical protein
MASLVNPSNINGNFPIAGQDNDSQGFRDNFTNIRNNFTFIKSEVEDLQAKAILKSALTGGTLDNNFLGSQLKNTQLKNYSETLFDFGTTSGDIQLDLALGNVNKLATSGEVRINGVIKNWPGSQQYSRILLFLTVTSTGHQLKLPTTLTTDLSGLFGLRVITGSNVVTFPEAGNYIFEFSSPDSGSTIFVKELTRANHLFRDPNFYFTNIGAGLAGSGHTSGFEQPTLKIAYGNIIAVSDTIDTAKSGTDALSVHGGVTSYFSYDSTSGTGEGSLDPSLMKVGGFSVARSRVTIPNQGTTPTQGVSEIVQDKDLLGYFNGLGFTKLQGTSTFTFQQMGSIQFHANGSSANGLGGNIVIATKADGTTGLLPAMVIDANQNVTVYGSLDVKGTTTTIESTTLTVTDKNIIVASGSTSADNSDTAGLSVVTGTGSWANLAYSGPTASGISGGVFGFNKGVNVSVATSSTDYRSGALIVAGGVGIAGALNINGALNVGGSFGLTSTTEATSTTSAAFTLLGGLATAKNIIAGGALFANSTAISTGSTSGALVVGGGTGIAGRLNVAGNVVLTSTDDTTGLTTGALIVSGGLNVAKSIIANTGPITFGATDNSTYSSGSAYTGVLRVLGGAHIVKTLNVGNDSAAGKIVINSDGTTHPGTAADSTTGALIVGTDAKAAGASITGTLNVGNDTAGILYLRNKNAAYGTNLGNFSGTDVDPSPYSVRTINTITGYGALTVKGGSNLFGDLFVGQPTGSSNSQFYSGNLYLQSGTPSTSASSGAIQIQKTRWANGYVSYGGLGMEGNLYAVGNVILGGGSAGTTTSNVVVDATTVSANVTTGALVVRGGVGIAGVVQAGGNLVLTSSSTGTSTTGALMLTSGGAFINGTSLFGGNVVIAGTAGSNYLGGTSTTGALLLKDGGLTVASSSATTWLGGQVTLNIATEATTGGAGALVLSGSGATKAGIYVAGNIVAGGSVQPINAVGAAGVNLISSTAIDQTIACTTTTTLTDITNMNFYAEAGKSYYFEAFIMHDFSGAASSATSATQYFVPAAAAGTLNYVNEQTLTQTSTAMSIAGFSGNNVAASGAIATFPQTSLLTRVTGTYYNSAAGTSKFFIKANATTNTGTVNLVIRGASFLKWTKLN